MHVLEKAFLDLLRNHISMIPPAKIFAGSKYSPQDNSPCITLNLADESFIRDRYVEIDNIQHIQKRYNADLWINLWCNSEEERTDMINDTTRRINEALANHYTTCSHFNRDDDICIKTSRVCESLNSQNGRANKKQCPQIQLYESFFTRNHIPKRTFCIDSITNLDELELTQPLLRTIFRLNMDYFTYYPIGGRVFEDYAIDEGLL